MGSIFTVDGKRELNNPMALKNPQSKMLDQRGRRLLRVWSTGRGQEQQLGFRDPSVRSKDQKREGWRK